MRQVLLSLCAFALVLAGHLAAQEVPAREDIVDPRLTAAVTGMLDAGYQSARVTKESLESKYRQASKELGQGHPWLDYAYSLALSKNLYNEEAQQFLQSAAESTAPVTLAAREELIRQKLRKQQYTAALESLADLAEVVGRIPPEGRAGEDAAMSAKWIGIVVGYLEGAIGLEEIRREAHLVAEPIRSYLEARYAAPFDNGRAEVGVTYHHLGRQLLESLRAGEEQKVALAAEADQKQQQLREQQQKIEQGAQQLADVAKEDLSEVDARIEALEKLLDSSLKAEQSLVASETQLRLEIVQLQQQRRFANNRALATTSSPFLQGVSAQQTIDDQIQIREMQITVLQSNYILLLQSRDQLVKRGNSLLQQRAAAAQKYGSRAGDLRDRMSTITRLQANIEKASQRQAKVPVEKLPEVATVRRRISDFPTYDKRTTADQKNRLLSLAGANPEQPGEVAKQAAVE